MNANAWVLFSPTDEHLPRKEEDPEHVKDVMLLYKNNRIKG